MRKNARLTKFFSIVQDIHLAKRFYDMAAETSTDAHLPVNIVLFKLHLELFWEKVSSWFSSSPSTSMPPTMSSTPLTPTSEHEQPDPSSIELDSSWDLYLMIALLGLIGALYTMLRQRATLLNRQQAPPVQ